MPKLRADSGLSGRIPPGDGPGAADSPGEKAAPSSLYDLQLLDVPPAAGPHASTADTQEAYKKTPDAPKHDLPEPDSEAPRRKLPWIVDILLYPMNKPGLSVLSISTGVPFLLRIIVRFFFIFMAAFPPMLVFWVLFIVIHWGVLAVLVLYVNWYFCECIRDSAAGGIEPRTPRGQRRESVKSSDRR